MNCPRRFADPTEKGKLSKSRVNPQVQYKLITQEFTMKTAAALLALFGSAAAFAPATPSKVRDVCMQ